MTAPIVTDSYRIVIHGTGVLVVDATDAFEAAVTALRAATAEGAIDPIGTLTHNEATTEQASDVV